MVKVRKVAQEVGEDYKFMARANVNMSIPVNKYESVRKYNNEFLAQLQAVNGDSARLPADMGYRWVNRGDILHFGDQMVVDPETGNIKVYPKEIYDDLSQRKVELPCLLAGRVDENMSTIKALASPRMKKALEGLQEDSARFRIKPFLEKYNEGDPDLED